MNHRENSFTRDPEFPSSRHRCFAVVGGGEAHPQSVTTDEGVLLPKGGAA